MTNALAAASLVPLLALAGSARAGEDRAALRPSSATTSSDGDWIVTDAAGVLRVRLAHAERPRPDGGTLVVDPNRRAVTWEGAPGEHGCRRGLEAPFARVRAVRLEPRGVLRLELRGEPRDRWLFVPVPHAAWLVQASSALVRGFLPDLRETLVSGARDAAAMPASGSAAFMGAQVRPDLVPAEVSADLRLALERVQRALERPALPSAAVQEALHGSPRDVAVADLLEAAAAHEARAVRVRGVVERARDRGLVLVDGEARVRVAPSPELAALVEAAGRDWIGEEVEFAGVFRRARSAGNRGGPQHEVLFWEYQGPDVAAESSADAVLTVSLRQLLERPSSLVGRTVRVVGNFRGRNLFGDLERGGPRGAWVLKAKRHAIWVTGHGPSGRGFKLDSHVVGRTSRWLEVLGTVETRDGRPLLRARKVALAAPATFVWTGPRLRASDPRPDVVFTLPLLGEEVPANDGRLLIQFSSYMDGDSFEGRVRVWWGTDASADREATRARFTYDAVRRVLLVDPGEPLSPGGTVEVHLLRGIEDVHAAVLDPPSGPGPFEAARVLRWRVGNGETPGERGDGQPVPALTNPRPGR